MTGSVCARLDHLVVAARTLEEGRAWLEGRLGVSLQPGGKHAEFGTHNLLLSLGPEAYLEVIAADPDAPALARPRWFALDTPELRERLEHGPALVHWVAAVPNLPAAPDVLPLSRGAYRWLLTVPADGSLRLGGVAPSLIQWLTPPPPARLPDSGLRPGVLRLGTPDPDALLAELNRLVCTGDVEVYEASQPELRATLDTPGGPIEL